MAVDPCPTQGAAWLWPGRVSGSWRMCVTGCSPDVAPDALADPCTSRVGGQ